jgi:NAD+ diphosphatase
MQPALETVEAQAALTGLCVCGQVHAFCGRCGSATQPIQHGSRRQCLANASHKAYPRTDPVVIVLLQSQDGSKALLGRPRLMSEPMYTCLSGFVEQCESIEEVYGLLSMLMRCCSGAMHDSARW